MSKKIEKFKVEELEQRFEMGWGPKKVGVKVGPVEVEVPVK